MPFRAGAEALGSQCNGDHHDTINCLHLPRYGMANSSAAAPAQPPNKGESAYLGDLSRAAGSGASPACAKRPLNKPAGLDDTVEGIDRIEAAGPRGTR